MARQKQPDGCPTRRKSISKDEAGVVSNGLLKIPVTYNLMYRERQPGSKTQPTETPDGGARKRAGREASLRLLPARDYRRRLNLACRHWTGPQRDDAGQSCEHYSPNSFT